jgi:hypothetical protein
MRSLKCLAPMALACLAGAATADTGLKLDAAGGYWFANQPRLHLQATSLSAEPVRLGYSTAAPLSRHIPLAASVTGDYYFSSDIAESEEVRTGFRASGALLIRQPGISLAEAAWTSRSTAHLGGSARLTPMALTSELAGAQAYSISTLPYVGIGYSGMSLKHGWGFWADVGLVVQSPGSAVGLGRALSGSQGVDEVLRELRMAPMVQLGVNYAF